LRVVEELRRGAAAAAKHHSQRGDDECGGGGGGVRHDGANAPGRRVIENKRSPEIGRAHTTVLQGECSGQTRGGGGGDSTSVECFFSIIPLPGRDAGGNARGAGGKSRRGRIVLARNAVV
jgi:hypothetical protein